MSEFSEKQRRAGGALITKILPASLGASGYDFFGKYMVESPRLNHKSPELYLKRYQSKKLGLIFGKTSMTSFLIGGAIGFGANKLLDSSFSIFPKVTKQAGSLGIGGVLIMIGGLQSNNILVGIGTGFLLHSVFFATEGTAEKALNDTVSFLKKTTENLPETVSNITEKGMEIIQDISTRSMEALIGDQNLQQIREVTKDFIGDAFFGQKALDVEVQSATIRNDILRNSVIDSRNIEKLVYTLGLTQSKEKLPRLKSDYQQTLMDIASTIKGNEYLYDVLLPILKNWRRVIVEVKLLTFAEAYKKGELALPGYQSVSSEIEYQAFNVIDPLIDFIENMPKISREEYYGEQGIDPLTGMFAPAEYEVF